MWTLNGGGPHQDSTKKKLSNINYITLTILLPCVYSKSISTKANKQIKQTKQNKDK